MIQPQDDEGGGIGGESVWATLPVGAYNVRLLPGWALEVRTNEVPVWTALSQVTLLSPETIQTVIDAKQPAQVGFRFKTYKHDIDFQTGMIKIDVDVTTIDCGNGIVEPFEQCDDGNTVLESCNYGETQCFVCSPICTQVLGATSYCGDSTTSVADGEVCEVGDREPAHGCRPDCTSSSLPRLGFVTSSLHDGNLGGADGADAICESQAAAQGLQSGWKAWLNSSVDGSVLTRLQHGDTHYQRMDGLVFATSWEDLIYPVNRSPLNVEPSGAVVAGNVGVWTGGLASGGFPFHDPGEFDCDGWTSNSGAVQGIRGNADAADETWSDAQVDACDQLRRLYCIKQQEI